MSTSLWLKIPHRLLHDPKWIRLSDRMKALTVQIALVAGDTDTEWDGGRLPPVDDLAVLLRVDPEDLETDLAALADVGYLKHEAGIWYASEFVRWQAEVTPDAERMREFRSRQRAKPPKAGQENGEAEPRNSYVTVCNSVTHTDTDSETAKRQREIHNVVVGVPAKNGGSPPSSVTSQGQQPNDDPLASRLEAEGLSSKIAGQISAEYSAPDIMAGIAVAKDYAAKHKTANFPGLLVKAIREGWTSTEAPDAEYPICGECGGVGMHLEDCSYWDDTAA